MSQEFDEKRTVKGLLLEMKLSDSSEMRIIAEETILDMFNQLKSQLEEKDAMIAELESSLRLLTLKAQSESEIQSLKQQLAEANKKLSWYQSGEIHTCHAECQRPFCVLHRQLESARGVIVSWIDFEDRSIAKEGPYVGMEINSLISNAKKWLEENK